MTTEQADDEPQFFKKFVNAGHQAVELTTESASECSSQQRRGSTVNNHDVIGKPLKAFYRKGIANPDQEDIQIPLVLIRVYEYFLRDQSRLATPDLFRKLDREALLEMDKLEQHFSLGDYKYIFGVKDPCIVAGYFKSVLKYMQEPLCTYLLYPKFRAICERMNDAQRSNNASTTITNSSGFSVVKPCASSEAEALMHLKHVISEMDQLHRDTWRFVLLFFDSLAYNNKVSFDLSYLSRVR